VLVPLFVHILVPLIALLAVAIIQFDRKVSVPAQMAEGGTDLCILAIGATGSVFISPKLHEKFGPEWMVLISIMIVLATVALAESQFTLIGRRWLCANGRPSVAF
jgi:hypothetical protein